LPLKSKTATGAVDSGFADTQSPSNLSLGDPLEKPASDKQFLGPLDLARTSSGEVIIQCGEAVLLVSAFPAAKGSNGIAEGMSQFLLRSHLTLPEHDTDKAEVWSVVEGDPVDRLVAAEDNAVAIVIDEPQTWGDVCPGVSRRV